MESMAEATRKCDHEPYDCEIMYRKKQGHLILNGTDAPVNFRPHNRIHSAHKH